VNCGSCHSLRGVKSRFIGLLPNLTCLQACSVVHPSKVKQVGQLSQANHAAACISFGKNITAKSMHLTSLYPTALTSANDHLTVLRHYVCT